jgi:putative peptidoglycan lipid II flippase
MKKSNKTISREIYKSTIIISSLSFFSSILGMFRNRILASKFGADDTLDIFNASFQLPDFIFNVFILGTLGSFFVPLFSKKLVKNKKRAYEFASSILNLTLIFIISASILAIIFAPFILGLIFPGYKDNPESPEKFEKLVLMSRIMFLSPIILSISNVFSGILTTLKKFYIYSMAPIMYNVGIIVGIYTLAPKFQILGLIFAVVLGAFLHLLVQLPLVIKNGFRFKLVLKIKKEVFHQLKRLVIPRSLSLIINQFNFILIAKFSSLLGSGAFTVYKFAKDVAEIPLTIFGAPFAIAVYADLALSYNRDKIKKFIHIFSTTFNKIAYFVIPTTVVLLTLRAQIIRLLYGTGKFDWEDTKLTFSILGFLALSLLFQCAIPLTNRAFFAIHNTLLPLIAGVISIIINYLLLKILPLYLGISGVALAYSISQIFNLVLLLIILYVKVGHLEDHNMLSNIVKISIGAVFAGVTIQIMKYLSVGMFDWFINSSIDLDLIKENVSKSMVPVTFSKLLFQTATSIIAGGAVYIFSTWYIGAREAFFVVEKVKSVTDRLLRRR